MDIMALLIGLLVGILIGWIWRNRGATATERERGAQAARLESQAGRLGALEAELDERRDAERDASHEAVKLRAQLESLTTRLEERKEDQKLMAGELKEQNDKLMTEKSKDFQERSQKSIVELMKPFKDQLEGFRKELTEKGQQATQERISLQEQVKLLRTLNAQIGDEARNLTRALKGDAKARGNWGEVLLSRVLELSGLEEGRDFVRERSETIEDNKRLRPDVVVNLPDDRHLVIDAKVTLVDYDAYCAADTDEDRQGAMKRHIGAIRTHVRGLAGKRYEHLGSLHTVDFVFMFMPIEAAFTEAMRHDSSFFDEAIAEKVLVVTPTNLLAALRSVETIWRHERQTKNVLEIARQAGALHDKFVGFAEDLQGIGKRIEQTQSAYEGALSKLSTGKGNLVSRVQKLEELGAKTKKKMPELLVELSEEDGGLPAPPRLTAVAFDEDA